MGKKKANSEYNDFLDGERLRDNAQIRTSLQASSARQDVSPPPTRREERGGKWKGGKGKGRPKKPPLTHFLCLPLINEASKERLAAALDSFKQQLEGAGLVPVKAVRPVGTLHLTLGVMSLDDEGLENAGRCLQELDLSALLRDVAAEVGAEGFGPLSMDLHALVPMQQPQKTSILYAEPRDATRRLSPFANKLRDYFIKKGVLIDDKRPLKLHATIVNTIYAKPGGRGRKGGRGKNVAPQRQDDAEHNDNTSNAGEKAGEEGEEEESVTAPPDPSTAETELPVPEEKVDRSEGHGPNAKSWMRFDATSLVEKYKDYVWAENVNVDAVQICKMGAKKHYNDRDEIVAEEYECVFSKPI